MNNERSALLTRLAQSNFSIFNFLIAGHKAMNAGMPCKVVFACDTNVGKTSIIRSYGRSKTKSNAPQANTVVRELTAVSVQYAGSSIKLDVWDTPGQQLFRSMVPLYFRASRIVVIIFDVTQEETYKNVPNKIDSSDGRLRATGFRAF
jgi:small GTP-binding protein